MKSILGLLFLIVSAAPATGQAIISAHPALSPEAAVAVLRGSHSIADRTNVVSPPAADGPTVVVFDGRTGEGPFGAFPRFPESRRLDGTYLSDPYPYYGGGWRGRPIIAPVGRAGGVRTSARRATSSRR